MSHIYGTKLKKIISTVDTRHQTPTDTVLVQTFAQGKYRSLTLHFLKIIEIGNCFLMKYNN